MRAANAGEEGHEKEEKGGSGIRGTRRELSIALRVMRDHP